MISHCETIHELESLATPLPSKGEVPRLSIDKNLLEDEDEEQNIYGGGSFSKK